MSSKFTLSALLFAGGMLAVTLPVSATSLPNLSLLKVQALEQSQVQKTHGWHRSCRKGLNGSHKHVKGVGRIQCTTAKCYTNIFGYRVCDYF